MSHLVYFSSVSENTHRFVQKLGYPADRVTRIPLHGRVEVDQPFVLVTNHAIATIRVRGPLRHMRSTHFH